MNEKENITFELLYDAVKAYINNIEELNIIKESYEFAKKTHEGEKRLSGDDYILHPINSLYILSKILSDYLTISSPLLHDVI